MTLLPWKKSKTTTALHEAAVSGDTVRLGRLLTNKKVNPNVEISRGVTPLHLAATYGLVEGLRELLSHPHINPNVQDANGKTPLHCAIAAGQISAVEALLDDVRTEVNLADKAGRTSLHHAVESNLPTAPGRGASRLATASDIDHTACDEHRRTALSWALHLGHKSVTDALISDRALPLPEVAAVDTEGRTALHWAVKRPKAADVALLAKHQATAVLNAKDNNGETALHMAARSNDGSSLRALGAAGADLGVRRDTDGATPLHIAVQQRSYGFMLNLKRLGPSQCKAILVKDHNGNTPLHLAAERGDSTMVMNILDLDNGPYPPMFAEHEANGNGDAPVDLAVRQGHIIVAIYLLQFENSESPVVRAKRQEAALALVSLLATAPGIKWITRATELLKWAARDGALAVFEAFWDHRSSAVQVDQCICIAASQGHLDVVQYLVEKDTNPNTYHESIGTPLYAATEQGHIGVMEFLLSLDHVNANHGVVEGDTPLMRAIRNRSAAAVSLLLDKKLLENRRVHLDAGVIHERDTHSNPLLLACELGYHDMAAMLVRRDFVDRDWINLDVKDWQRRTPLSIACKEGHSRIVELLLQASFWRPGLIRLDAQDMVLRTPFSYACASHDHRTVELFLGGDLLDRELFDPGASDNTMITPLGYACYNGRIEVVKLFCRDPRLRHCLNPQELFEQGISAPIIHACQTSQWQVVDLLLQTFSNNGLMESAMMHNRQGESVLRYALKSPCSWKTIHTLLASGFVKWTVAEIYNQLKHERETKAKTGVADGPEMELVAEQLGSYDVDDAAAPERLPT